jgi:hypothetical protein
VKYKKTTSAPLLKAAFKALVKAYNIQKKDYTTTNMWNMYHIASTQLLYKDLTFTPESKRIIEHNPEFESYPLGIDDSHIETYLKSLKKEIFS